MISAIGSVININIATPRHATAATTWFSVNDDKNIPMAIKAAPRRNIPMKLQNITGQSGEVKKDIITAYISVTDMLIR